MKKLVLEMSRQSRIGKLSPWFDKKLNQFIGERLFLPEKKLLSIKNDILSQLSKYREDTGISEVAIGVSGGVDSALTASLFKEAGWNVTGMLMPILQHPEETERGVELCESLGIKHHIKDLTLVYNMMLAEQVAIDGGLSSEAKPARVRKGNIRARLRMITLYNLAAAKNGLVASTDNFSELSSGFWTLHGDVGDLAPIQSLYKSWEVPMLAKEIGVPEKIWRAKPTDGLGVDDGDEAQFGCSYLEWDIMLMSFLRGETDINEDRARVVYDLVEGRMRSTIHKRQNPVNLSIQVSPYRFQELEELDRKLGE